MAETYNFYNKEWKRTNLPSLEDIQKIVGKVEMSIDSEGNIEINKVLTAEEKAKIEQL